MEEYLTRQRIIGAIAHEPGVIPLTEIFRYVYNRTDHPCV